MSADKCQRLEKTEKSKERERKDATRKKLEEEEYVLVSTGGDRATLRDVRKRLRNARNSITVLRKGNPTLEKRLADPGLYRDVVLVPADKLPLRVAKFDVVLREDALQATRAMHAVTSRMVVFWCKWCNESFPTFHPAYDPADAGVELELSLIHI